MPVALALTLLLAAERAAGERMLAASEAALDRADPGWRLADLVAARNAACPPDDQNLTKLCERIAAARPKRLDLWWADHGDWRPTPPRLSRLPSVDGLLSLIGERQAAEAAAELASAVRRLPAGGFRSDPAADPVGRQLKAAEPARPAAAVLEVVAGFAAVTRDGSRAVAATRDILHLCQVAGDEPGYVPQMIRLALGGGYAVNAAERTLAWCEPPAADLVPLQAALLAEADFPRLALALRGERAFTQLYLAKTDAGELDALTLRVLAGDRPFDLFAYRTRLPRDRAALLTLYTELQAVARRPSYEWADRFAVLRPPADDGPAMLSRAFHFDLVTKIADADRRVIARLRCAAVGLACERFRQAAGRWPADLAELKDLLPAVPLDPYDGRPLRYRRLTRGVVVYAVGPDRTDDGGRLSDQNPRPGEDVGFRLWDVAARRRPAEGQP